MHVEPVFSHPSTAAATLLTDAEQEIVFHQLRFPQTPMYNIGGYVEFHQEIDTLLMTTAFDEVLASVPRLGQRLQLNADRIGFVAAPARPGLEVLDLSDRATPKETAKQWLRDAFDHVFDLDAGPLFKSCLIKLASKRYWYCTVAHHVLIDGWGYTNWLKLVYQRYSTLLIGATGEVPAELKVARALPPAPYDYERASVFWQKELQQLPDLLFRKRAGANGQGRRHTLHYTFPADTARRISAVCSTHGGNEYSFFIAVLYACIARRAQCQDVLIGLPVHNRRSAADKQAVSLAVQVCPLRLSMDESRHSITEIAAAITRSLRRSFRHAQYPLSRMYRDLGINAEERPFLFETTFNYQKLDFDFSSLGLDCTTHFLANGHESEPISLTVCDFGGKQPLQLKLDYHLHYLDAGEAQAFLDVYLHMAEQALVVATQPIGQLSLLPAPMADALHSWQGRESDFPSELCVHQLFEQQVDRTPDAVAISFLGRDLTYADLDRRANQLAAWLLAHGARPDQRVALLLERGPDLLVGLLGILKAGACYVPLDPSQPSARLAAMLDDAQPVLIVTQESLLACLPQGTAPVLKVDTQAYEIAECDARRPGAAAGGRADDLAYVIFTSGSTGKPKGVMVPHRGVVNLLWAMRRQFGIGAGDRIAALTTISFDIAALEMFLPLIGGASIELVERSVALDPVALNALIEHRGITIAQATPATWSMLLDDGWRGAPHLKLLCGGEALSARLAARLQDCAGEVWNGYGPTETTIYSTMFRVPAGTAQFGASVPIGMPIDNTAAYILDGRQRMLPVGTVGELYLGGVGIARGYLGQPGMSEERFLPDPFSAVPGARMYRTGDLARWNSAGLLEYAGRNDHQVKVRGFRIELGEIEAALARHPELEDAAVKAIAAGDASPVLVAYFIAREGAAPSAVQLRAHLLALLPDYMVPAAFVELAAWPVTASGKLDRLALPLPSEQAFSAAAYEAPTGACETAVAAIWAELLGRERIGRNDHFFEIGGHSLLAARVVAHVRQALGSNVTLASLFAEPRLARFCEIAQRAEAYDGVPLLPATREGALALSFEQQRLWFLSRLDGGSRAYHMSGALRMRGALRHGALRCALDGIVARHEVLRTVIEVTDGVPHQVVRPAGIGFALEEYDLRHCPQQQDRVQALSDEEHNAPFDFENGPLIRGRLLRLGETDYLLLITIHHVIFDGWSLQVFLAELAARYGAFPLGAEPAPLSIQFADYALWQRQRLSGALLAQRATFWRAALDGAPALLELPADRRRPPVQDHRGGTLALRVPATLVAPLRALALRHQATLFMTVLASWATLLARLSGQECVVVGAPVANRGRPELDGLIGIFANTLPLKIDVGTAGTIAGLIAQVKARVVEAQQHQDLPFEQVVEIVQPMRSLAHTPLFQAMLSWQSAPLEVSLPGLEVELLEAPQVTAQCDICLTLREEGDELVGAIEYATGLFDRATVARYAEHWLTLLFAMGTQSEAVALARMPLLSPAQLDQLERFSGTSLADTPPGLLQRFAAAVSARPDAPAVIDAAATVSYLELERMSNRIAHALAARGTQASSRVAFCVERGALLPAAVLGILKTGAAYVPLVAEMPLARIGDIVDDAGCTLLLADRAGAAHVQGLAVELLSIDAIALDEALPTAPLERAAEPDALAYITFTSGTTGKPKGVPVTLRSMATILAAWEDVYALHAERDRWLQMANANFDVFAGDLLRALGTGNALVVCQRATMLDPAALYRQLQADRVTAAEFVPAVLRELCAYLRDSGQTCPHLRLVVVGSDSWYGADQALALQVLAPSTRLINTYGVTEACIDSTYHEATDGAEDGAMVAIGKPFTGSKVYLVDRELQRVPVGVTGELCLGGVAVSRGYLNRPDLSAAKFVRDPFDGAPDALLYRTGDVARINAKGVIELLGRADFQVKLRGFRIELGEIETALQTMAGVRQAIVNLYQPAAGDARLVAYMVADSGQGLLVSELKAGLRKVLPDYMIPQAWVVLDALPRTAVGKVDRNSLPAPAPEDLAGAAYVAPQGERERAIAGIWMQVLRVPQVGRDDNFFDLGGHSLLVVQVIGRMRLLGLAVDIKDMFAARNLAELAQVCRLASSAAAPIPANGIPTPCAAIAPHMLPLVTLSEAQIQTIAAHIDGGMSNIADIYPLAPLQEGILFHHMMDQGIDTYLMPSILRVDSRSRLDALLAALNDVIARHDVLRTAVLWQYLPTPLQVVLRAAPLPVTELKVQGDAVQALRGHVAEQQSSFALDQAPLMRAVVAADGASGAWYVLLLQHHIIGDHVSVGILLDEVRSILGGRQAQLPQCVPYRNFVASLQLDAHAGERHRQFFSAMLATVDEPTAPFGVLETHVASAASASAVRELPRPLAAQTRAMARQYGVTSSVLFHVAWTQVLAATTGRDDVVFGTVLSGRSFGGDVADRTPGVFINTLPLRAVLAALTAGQAVPAMRDLLGALMQHEHASLTLAQACSNVAAPTPLFTAIFNYRQTATKSDAAIEGVAWLETLEWTNYPVALSVDDDGDGFTVSAQCELRIDAGRMLDYLVTALAGLLQALHETPDAPLLSLPVLGAAERELVLHDLNATQQELEGSDCLIHHLFERQAARTPDAVALVCEGREMSYAQLDFRANQLARHLRALGVQTEDRVALFLERSFEMVVSMLAVLKAGAAYLPLDPDYPEERIAYMLEDGAPPLVLTQKALLARLPHCAAPLLQVDADWSQVALRDGSALTQAETGLRQSHLAYVIYTSGSTGRPKGVMNEHGGVVNRLLWMQDRHPIGPADRLLQKTPYSFDVSVWEFFWPLSAGARLVMARPQGHKSPEYLAQTIVAEAISTMHFVPSMLQAFMASSPTLDGHGLRRVFCSGEALSAALRDRFMQAFPEVEMHNLYGPTEAAIEVAAFDCAQAGWPDSVPIGRPVPNTRLYILDPRGEPVPFGVAGEIHIGGVQVARGYLNLKQLTEERFVADPFAPTANARMYKTGDLGRWSRDGNIEYLGRNDFQLKIRGQRIELGEIEARLAELASVREAVVVAREDVPGDRRLVAYYTALQGEAVLDSHVLRAHLGTVLPEHMVPSAFVRLDAMPISASGKLDRKALPAPELDAFAMASYEPPVGALEQLLAATWGELFGLEQVGRHDDFFALGGHSMTALQAVARLQAQGVALQVKTLFMAPTPAKLASLMSGATQHQVAPCLIAADCEAIRPAMLPLAEMTQEEIDTVVAGVAGGARNVQDIYPLMPMQEGILFHHLLDDAGDTYVMQAMLAFERSDQVDQFLAAFGRAIERHDALRSQIAWEGLREPVQVVLRQAELSLEIRQFAAADGAVIDQLKQAYSPATYRMDLRRGPLLHAALTHDGDEGRWLLLLLHHHILTDHTALSVVVEEIAADLAGQRQFEPAPQFRNFIAQARSGTTAAEHEQFFRDMLGTVTEPTVPVGLGAAQVKNSNFSEARAQLDTALVARLRLRARELGISVASLFHLAWARVLGTVSLRDDVVFGTILYGRLEAGASAAHSVGLFINTLPLRVTMGEQSLRAALQQTHQLLNGLLRHEHAPLSLAQRCSALGNTGDLIGALFNFRRGDQARQRAENGAIEVSPGIQVLFEAEFSNYAVNFDVDDWDHGIGITAQVCAPLRAEEFTALMTACLQAIDSALQSSPETLLRRLSLLAPEQEEAMRAAGCGESMPVSELCLHQSFEQQVLLHPDAPAIIDGARSFTYAEVNRMANRIAHRLLALGLGDADLVALHLERSYRLPVAQLAVLKAGAAYVPLEPGLPAERLAYFLDDAAPCCTLADSARVCGPDGKPWFDFDQLAADPTLSDVNPAIPALGPDRLAYVVYTSGTTGKPKGVMVEHRAMQVRLHGWIRRFGFDAEPPRVLQMAGASVDICLGDLLKSLCTGGSLVICAKDTLLDMPALYHLMETTRVTFGDFVPALLRELCAYLAASGQRLNHVRHVLVGSESWYGSDLAALHAVLDPRGRCFNVYGQTESVIDVSTCDLTGVVIKAERVVPMGQALPNTALLVLDAEGRVCPPGAPGELYIGGPGLARGYLGRATESAERFLAHPTTGTRLYRTGDFARYCLDGTLDFLGRLDDQIKIRGFRIELGEIETALHGMATVRQAVVSTYQSRGGDRRLAAYLVAHPGQTLDMTELKAGLREMLPDYMIPSAWVSLQALPLTATGKIDRNALPPPPEGADSDAGHAAPVGSIEQLIAGIWCDVLKCAQVGRYDNFFDLGGHSLLAVQVIGRMRQAGLQAAIKDLLTAASLAQFALQVTRLAREHRAVPPNGIPDGCQRIEPAMLPLITLSEQQIAEIAAQIPGGQANIQDIYPLAPLQEGILFHHIMDQASDTYVLSSLAKFDSRQHLDAVLNALQEVLARHDILRTAILWRGLPQALQVVVRQARLSVEELPAGNDPLTALKAQADPRVARFDLGQAPLMRVFTAADPASGACYMLLLEHHIIGDHISLEILLDEVRCIVDGRRDELLVPVPYRNFVARLVADPTTQAEQDAFFTRMLGDIDEPTAPFGLLDVKVESHRSQVLHQPVPAALAAQLRALAKKLALSPAVLFHAAWAQMLAALSGRDDLVFGTVLSGRDSGVDDVHRIPGVFINTLPLRVTLDDRGAEACVFEIRDTLAELVRFEQASLAQAQRCSAVVAPAPLFTTILNFRHSAPGEDQPRNGVQALEGQEWTNYPLTMAVDDESVGFELHLHHDWRLPGARVIAYMQAALAGLAEALRDTPRRALRSLSVLPPQEQDLILRGFNATHHHFDDGHCLLHELVERQVARTPDAIALVCEDQRLTYADLDRRANQLAHYLIAHGARPDVLVALFMERSVEMVVSMLAVLKAGAAYLPLDPDYPSERIAYMLDDAAAPMVLVREALAERLPACDALVLAVDGQWSSLACYGDSSTDRRGAGLRSSHLAYVIYTSGSTGKPKGVMNEHGGVVNRLLWMQHTYRLDATDCVLQKTPYGFDVSVWEFFWPLMTGARLVMARPDGHRSPDYLARTAALHGVTTWHFVPSMLEAFLAHGAMPASMRRVFCSGEALPPGLRDQFLAMHAEVQLHNLYGPTEAAIDVTAFDCRQPGWPGTVPLGRPVANTSIYVLDARGAPVPLGVAGEIHIGGVQVARGYLNQDALSAERFVPDPFAAVPGRMYKTGDLGRFNADGNLEYLGRNDFQLKLRGLRIELGEIETQLRRLATVREAVVVACPDHGGDPRLVAYYTTAPTMPALDVHAMRSQLAQSLPAYMVPAAFVHMEAMPLSANGKLDRKALPAPEEGGAAEQYEAPTGPVEPALAAIWAALFKLPRLGRHDDFFALGGHSLMALRLLTQIQQQWNIECDLNVMFVESSLQRQAAAIERALAVRAQCETMNAQAADADEGFWL